MRVLVVTAWEPWHRTEGNSLVLDQHLRQWVRRHDVEVVAASREPGSEVVDPDESGVPVPVRRFGRRVPGPVDYAGRRLWGLVAREPAHVRWVLRPALLRAVDEAIARRRPDVLHLFGWGTAGLWRRARGVPAVHMAVDPWTVNLGNRRLPGWRRPLEAGTLAAVRRHERRHYPHLAAVVVVAPHDAEQLAREVPSARVEVVVNGVEPGPEPGPMAAEPVLAFHGAYEAQANVDAALVLAREVLPAVRRAVPAARALLVGRDPPPELTALRSDEVEVTGAVPDVRATLARAAVHVDPMVSGTGLKNKVLEAMAAGLPVVGTPLALAGIGAGDGVVEAATPRAMADAVAALLQDPGRRAAAGAAARARVVRDFSWAASAAAVERLWESAAAREHTPGPP